MSYTCICLQYKVMLKHYSNNRKRFTCKILDIYKTEQEAQERINRLKANKFYGKYCELYIDREITYENL